MRQRRREQGLREIRVLVPDTRLPDVRRELARQIATLQPEDERDIMDFIEAVSVFGDDAEG